MGTIIVGAVVLLLLLLSLRVRRMRVRRLWVMPTIVSLFCLLAILNDGPTGAAVWLLPLGFCAGALLGVLRGRLAVVWAYPPRAAIAIKQSVTGVALWATVLVAKVAFRFVAAGSSADRAATATVAAFTAGTVLAYAGWLYRRYRRGEVEPWPLNPPWRKGRRWSVGPDE